MADTIGTLIDKLTTVDLKMWNTQELLYEIRKMTFEQYKSTYFDTEDGAKLLWERLKNATDLNAQRNILIDEIDLKLLEVIRAVVNGDDLMKYIQLKHKTY